ncbi:MAG: LLM class F420-dependent oxidoreductase [Acidimicrobiales bacterium]
MKFGILTPVLSLVPGGHSDWEIDGTIDDVRQVAQAADRLGFDYLTCSEHMAIPSEGMDLPGPRYWDPLSTFGYLAAHTSRIRLATSVLVLGYHHPLEIAKRFGTLDRICEGRLIMGVGAGYLKREFELLGSPYEDRGPRVDDAIRAIKASFGRRTPAYDGPFFRFEGIVVDPCALQAPAPIWVGGRSVRSLRRAVELADGWCPFATSPRRAAAWLGEARATEAWGARDRPLDVVLAHRDPMDPSLHPDATAAAVEELRDAGVTTVSLRFVHRSLTHYLEQLEAMAALIGDLSR